MRHGIRKARVARGLSHQQMAKAIGVSRLTWAKWEAGASSPGNIETIVAILNQIGRSDLADELGQLFKDDGEESINAMLAKYPPARIPNTDSLYSGRAQVLARRRTGAKCYDANETTE